MKLMLIVALGCLIASPALAQAPIQNKPKVTVAPDKNKLDSQSDLSEEEQMRLQKLQDRRQKAQETESNVIKKQSDTNSTIIQNMK